MPYKDLADVPASIRGIDPPVTLEQANVIASWADAIAGEPSVDNPWAIAIAKFKKLYEPSGTGSSARWRKRETLAESAFIFDQLLQDAFDAFDEALLEARAPFPHAGGKTLVIKHILPLIPKHDVWVEPFSGTASVYFAQKDPAPKVILSDIDEDLIFALNFVKSMTEADKRWLLGQNWRGTPSRYKFIRNQRPVRRLERMYRHLYLNMYSWAGQPSKGYAHGHGAKIQSRLETMQRAQDHMKKSEVIILCQSAQKTVEQFDAPGVFFYCDPPYPGSGDDQAFNNNIPTFDELKTLTSAIKEGKWMMSLADNKEAREAFGGNVIKEISVRQRYSNLRRSKDEPASVSYRKELLVMGYDPDTSVDVSAKDEGDGDNGATVQKAPVQKAVEQKTWTTEYINNLPDSAFLYIESGGDKDADGKTIPRSLRHLPFKDAEGDIDLAHLRNAISRVTQIKDKDGNKLPDAIVAKILSRARQLLDSQGIKKVQQETKEPQGEPQDDASRQEPIFLYGPVLIPDKPDAHNQSIDPEEILRAVREMPKEITIDIEHKEPVNRGAVRVTQAFVLPVNATIAGQKFKKNTAIVEVEVIDPAIIARVKSNELRGFSIYGTAKQSETEIEGVTIDRISIVRNPAIRQGFSVVESI